MPNDTPKLCPKCGTEMEEYFGVPDCPLGPEQCELMAMLKDGVVPHAELKAALAKLAAAEAKVRELEEGDEALLAVLPEDFGAVEYIKHLTAANAALEEKQREAEKPCVWTEDEFDSSWDGACGVKWCFIEAGAEENGIKFCPGCGHPVVVNEVK